MEKNAPEYKSFNWIWWSLLAIVLTAVLTVTLVGLLTGSWPWNRDLVDYNGRPSQPTETVIPTDTTSPEETTLPEETEESIKPGGTSTQTTEPTTSTTEPTTSTTEPTVPNNNPGNGNTNTGGNGNGTTTTDPTESTRSS